MYFNPHKQVFHTKLNRRFTRLFFYLKLLFNKFVLNKRIFVINPWISISWGKIEHNNWGDDINCFFLRNITKDCILPEGAFAFPSTRIKFYGLDRYPVISAIGSVFGMIDNQNTIVWGSGLLTEDALPPVAPKKIAAVRGPLTRQVLLQKGFDCPEVYGDPALLLPYYYKPKNEKKKYRLGIVPHYIDFNKAELDKFRMDDSILIIKMFGYKRWTDVIDEIYNCEFVVSSSLHGLIVAESYNVPNLWVEIKEPIADDSLKRFKFHDYFQSVGLDRENPFLITLNTTVEDILSQRKNYVKSPGLSLEPLVRVCPFKLELKV